VCSTDVGASFRATLAAEINAGGATIPRGATATGVVTASDQWGAGLGVRITSIHADGVSYPIISRVTYVVPENTRNGACIPRRSHIDTEVRD
jgi:hypothetical protein